MSAAKTANRPTPPAPAARPAPVGIPSTPAQVEAAEKEAEAKKAAALKAKSERFTKLAVARVNKAIKSLEAVAALGNKRSYAYSDDQAQKVKDAITASSSKVLAAFSPDGGAAGFTL
jgi:hypothetical protein